MGAGNAELLPVAAATTSLEEGGKGMVKRRYAMNKRGVKAQRRPPSLREVSAKLTEGVYHGI